MNGISIFCACAYSLTLILLKFSLVPKPGLLVAKRLCLSPNLAKKRQIFTPEYCGFFHNACGCIYKTSVSTTEAIFISFTKRLYSQDGMSGKEALIFYCCGYGLNHTSKFMSVMST